ncbi:MAG TPA: ATP-binding protein [Gemmatimonadaceae bacterium]|nr:ATP-binding protein [Gemmatimonadaceae bacterium]
MFEERLRLALEAGEMGTWEYRVNESRVVWSETLERIHGLAPGSFGGTFEEYKRDIHPEDRKLVFDTIRRTLAGAPHRLRYRIIRPDGVTRWVEARGTMLMDEHGAPQRIVGVCMDITERESADLELERQRAELERQTAALLQLNVQLQNTNDALLAAREDAETAQRQVSEILSAITDPFVVHDSEWRFRYLNEAATKTLSESLGNTKDSLIGKTLWELYPDIVGTLFEKEMRRAQESRVTVTFEEYYPRRAAWAELRCYPLPGGGIATIWKNITEQKREAERQHYIREASDILASSLDYKATVTQLAELLVPKLADWCGIRLLDENGALQQLAVAHVNPEKLEWLRTASRRFQLKSDADAGPMYVLRTGNTELYEDVSEDMLSQMAVDEDHLAMLREVQMRSIIRAPLKVRGRVIGVMSLVTGVSGRRYTEADKVLAEQLAVRAAIAIDNARSFTETETARRALEKSRQDLTSTNAKLSHINEELVAKTRLAEQSRAEAEAANRSKADFLAHMSHELRTPLNAIAGYSELMELGLHGPTTPEQTEDLRRIKKSQRHLLSLINDVLNFAKLEATHVRYEIKPVSVSQAVSALEALIAPQLTAKQLTYVPGEIDEALFALGDEEKIQQILLNLLSNAVKFTGPGGRISIAATRVEDWICIEVVDTGVGIPPDKQKLIFEPFVQLERTLSSPHEGTGLGLAISRDLARGMRGELTVDSTLGRGSAFSLRLPAVYE